MDTKKMLRCVIISADDFGLVEGVNRGIEDALEQGALTSTSLMANTPGFEDAVERARGHSSWSIGVHLNILRGSPVLPTRQVPSLVKDKFFRYNFLNLAVACFDPYVYEQVEREYRAQIEKILSRGIRPDHIDAEKHHHMIPGIFKIVLRLAGEYDIPFVRIAREMRGIPVRIRGKYPSLSQIAKSSFLDILGRQATTKLARTSHMDSNPAFWGLYHSGNMTVEAYEHFFRHFQGDLVEIMCHPGYETERDNKVLRKMGQWYLWGKREKELEALLDDKLKFAAKQTGVQLVSFGEL